MAESKASHLMVCRMAPILPHAACAHACLHLYVHALPPHSLPHPVPDVAQSNTNPYERKKWFHLGDVAALDAEVAGEALAERAAGRCVLQPKVGAHAALAAAQLPEQAVQSPRAPRPRLSRVSYLRAVWERRRLQRRARPPPLADAGMPHFQA